MVLADIPAHDYQDAVSDCAGLLTLLNQTLDLHIEQNSPDPDWAIVNELIDLRERLYEALLPNCHDKAGTEPLEKIETCLQQFRQRHACGEGARPGALSGLDAAAQILREAGEPMSAPAIVEKALAAGLLSSQRAYQDAASDCAGLLTLLNQTLDLHIEQNSPDPDRAIVNELIDLRERLYEALLPNRHDKAGTEPLEKIETCLQQFRQSHT